MRNPTRIVGSTSAGSYNLTVWQSALSVDNPPQPAILLGVGGDAVHVAAKDAEEFALAILAELRDQGYGVYGNL